MPPANHFWRAGDNIKESKSDSQLEPEEAAATDVIGLVKSAVRVNILHKSYNQWEELPHVSDGDITSLVQQ